MNRQPANQSGSGVVDAIVIGGGVIGLASAWELARGGARVRLFERDRPGRGTSRVAAGMLAPVGELDFGEPDLLAMNQLSAGMYPDFVRGVEEASGLDAGLMGGGALHVALDSDEAAELKRILKLQQDLGLDSKWLGPSAAREVEPSLSPSLAGAVLAGHDGVVDPRALCAALAAALEAGGVDLRSGAEVKSLLCPDGAVWEHGGGPVGGVRLTDGSEHFAPVVIVAAGPESGRAAWLPEAIRPPIRPVKGQVIELKGDPDNPVISRITGSERVYVAPRRDGRLFLGATVEEMGFDSRVTAGGVHELLREGYRLIPEIAELEFLGALVGFRPGTPDNLPLIGPLADGLILAAGHYRNGILLAPLTASAVAGLARGERLSGPVAAGDPSRFLADGKAGV